MSWEYYVGKKIDTRLEGADVCAHRYSVPVHQSAIAKDFEFAP